MSGLLLKRGRFTLILIAIAALICAQLYPFPISGLSAGTEKYMCVALIYLLSGAEVDASMLRNGHIWKISAFIQSFTFIFVPIFIRAVIAIADLFTTIDPWINKGFIAAACMPPALHSAVLLTKFAAGNEGTAMLNSVLGTFLGIFLTPALLILHMGVSSTIPIGKSCVLVMGAAVVPAIAGHVLRRCIPTAVSVRASKPVWTLALFYTMFSSFRDLFHHTDINASAVDVLAIVILVVVTQMLLCIISVRLASIFLFINDTNSVAVIFCSTHKTLTIGLSIIGAVYGGYAHAGQMTLPLLVYTPVQLLLGSILSPWLLTPPPPLLPI